MRLISKSNYGIARLQICMPLFSVRLGMAFLFIKLGVYRT